MSDIIHLLPDSVANQIAAGEVIQRPASVIKELVENSLDAGAGHIEIVVEDAGKSLVQVVDDGQGMSATDARLAFERHATSKIKQATDLFSLRTMGFRGEALPSIAAVSQVELRTRMADEEIGVCLNIEGSKITAQEPVACPVGANFSIRNLFFNIPARRKFLKSNQTELANIMAEIERVALAHPDVAITLYSGGTTLLNLPSGGFRQRIVSLFGKKTDSQIVPVEADTSLVRITGFIGMPSSARRKNAHQYFFTNGRFMRHPYYAKAIQMAYERLVPEGQQVPFFIHLEVDPSRIDVNIHPTKTEIKFEDDNAIFQILLASVREALGKFGAVPAIDFNVEGKPHIPAMMGAGHQTKNISPPKIHIDTSFNPFEQNRAAYAGQVSVSSSPPPSEATLYASRSYAEQSSWEETKRQDFLQYQGHYIVTTLNDGLAVIDQHRAHIRILYERYIRQLQGGAAASQRLLFPEMMAVSPSEAVVLEKILPQLQGVGFDISPLGNGSFSILAMPAGTEGIAPGSLVEHILADAVAGQAQAHETVSHLIARAMARKVAIPVGQVLQTEEMGRLVEALFTCSTPNLTPDGLPTLVMLVPDKMF